MPPVPNTASTLLTFPVVISNISTMRPRLDRRSNRGFVRAATSAKYAFTASAPARGSSISRNSERAIFAGSTETPGSNNGRTSGK